ncbi:MAG TPA: Chromate resistance protein ChrB, partial [Gammaproteobacteria bacterium]|nr:Chromate resistance protein ChrB [Gammaproteobacteria bacterium]
MSESDSHQWLLLAASLPGREASTARVRLWRTLKELGAANLRDGVTLVPASAAMRERLEEIVEQAESEGGSAWLFEIPPQMRATEQKLTALFDRAEAYDAFLPALAALRAEMTQLDEATARRRLRQIERNFASIAQIDFFPAAGQARLREMLDQVRASVNRRFSPEEPIASQGAIIRRELKAFQGQRWATRKRLWIDRATSAWLIQRFVDPRATFQWL